MSDRNTVANLLVDPETGAILHINSGAPDFFGYPLAQLKNMNISDFSPLSAREICEKTGHSDQLQVVPLKVRHASGRIYTTRTYASSVTTQNASALFMCIFDQGPESGDYTYGLDPDPSDWRTP